VHFGIGAIYGIGAMVQYSHSNGALV